ncbi:MAG: acetoacetate--CoA ligase [Gemmatimonadaceae bacterium]
MSNAPMWVPDPARVARSQIVRFAQECRAAPRGAEPFSYDRLYDWSIERPAEFWSSLWRYCGVVADARDGAAWDAVVRGLDRMAPPDPSAGPRWFTGARLNFAENLLRHRDDREALVSWTEQGRRTSVTYHALWSEVSLAAASLRAHGVGVGDRVAAFMPNVPETVIAMLATASIGAIWSSCSPDFGVGGVLDRFGQIGPCVLFAADGYRYAGKEIDLIDRVGEIAAAIPEIQRVVIVPLLRATPSLQGIRAAMLWNDWRAMQSPRGAPPDREDTSTPSPRRQPPDGSGAAGADARELPDIAFARLPFDHPLYIMYSSGTTGLPKCMVHGAGGTLLQHLKEHVLHTDLTRDDRIFYFTTCGWMMWNWLVSALAVGATIVLYDGNPLAPATRAGRDQHTPGPDLLWQMAEDERLTVFGTSAKYLALAEKEGIRPRTSRDLSALRAVLSTGSPLAPPSFDYVYRDIKRDLQLASISGGTDIISCFALGNPAGPVWRGELQVRGLGMKVEVFGDDGRPVRGEPGELVCTMPFPSMPVAFWNDPEGAKYRSAYFDTYPGVWRHGDWAELTGHGGLIITGRSDATLNPGGVRIGTAEIYRQVEQLPEVIESLVIGQEIGGDRERDVRVVLFVRLRQGVSLDDALRDRIRRQVRANTSPHHVPKVIVQVADIPRTISGKITELAVRDVIHGRVVKNTDALANPQALELYRNIPELAS